MSSLPFPPTTDELIETFDELENWDERYDYLIDLGKEMPTHDVELYEDQNKVSGCMSTVWLTLAVDPATERVLIKADSDSLIVKGLIVVLLSAMDAKTAQQILETEFESLFNKLGLDQHLSANRRNGLFAMVKRVRQLAAEHLL
jgi:cysteine desulfuration protein SufE